MKAINGKIDIYLDGGIRKGTDIFKALALGAKAVFIGRPALWGLAFNVCYFWCFKLPEEKCSKFSKEKNSIYI